MTSGWVRLIVFVVSGELKRIQPNGLSGRVMDGVPFQVAFPISPGQSSRMGAFVNCLDESDGAQKMSDSELTGKQLKQPMGCFAPTVVD